MDEMSENFRRMRAGETYHAPDFDMIATQNAAAQKYLAINATEGDADPTERNRLLRDALGHFGASFLNPPVRWEYGTHVFIGDNCLINTDTMFMDGADIRIGDFTLVAPRCAFVTAGHPVLPEERIIFDDDGHLTGGRCVNKPIVVGAYCWIGAGSTVLGGVTIGDGTTVAAGSVVTKSLPPRVLAAGVPARVISDLPVPD